MKTVVKGLIRNEKGYLLITVLILLVVGGLILTPLLGLMSTGLLAGKVYEKKMDELYAADAGVEDAIWRIQTNNLTFENNCSGPWRLTVNGKNVTVEVYGEDLDPTCGENFTYQILSIAATDDGGGTAAIDSSTTIDAHIVATPQYYPSMMDHLVTIQGTLTKTEVNDLEQDLAKIDIACPEECSNCTMCKHAYDYYTEYDTIPEGCKGCIAVYNFPSVAWPTAESLSSLWSDAQGEQPDDRSIIDLEGNNMTLGPLKRLDVLTIQNKGKDAATLTLTGSLYITGETLINGPSGNEPYKLTVDLDGHTIYVSNNTSKALEITQCNVRGPGIIIAIGDIKFAPKLETGVTDPIFVVSLLGTTKLWPSGDFYGAVAGNIDVDLSSGNTPSATYPAGGFNYTLPQIVAGWTYSIVSWEINPD
jgi:hypothetical protein